MGFKKMAADWLKRNRESRGVSQSELADWAGVKQETISRWETGKVPLDRDDVILIGYEFAKLDQASCCGDPIDIDASLLECGFAPNNSAILRDKEDIQFLEGIHRIPEEKRGKVREALATTLRAFEALFAEEVRD